MKKVTTMILALIFAAAALTGCGGSDTASNGTTSGSAAQSSKAESKITGTVATDGSTSMEKVIGALGESFMQKNDGAKFTYNPTGSGSGITAVSEGRCDIGLASRKLKDDEEASGLTETTLALDGIAIIVNTANAAETLTLDDISKIYKGEITDWSKFGGSGPIVVIGREAGSGTRDGFETITDTKDACKYRQELTSTGDVITSVSGNKNAIGYSSLASVKDTVKVVSVDGVKPSEQTVTDGTYKIQRPFMLITKTGTALSAVAQSFYDYATSAEAAEVIKQTGVVPAAK